MTGCWKQPGKQQEHQPPPRARILWGSFLPTAGWNTPCCSAGRHRKLWHIWAVISAYTDSISKHQEKIWHFSFNNLSLHVNALKLKTNIGGGNFLYGKRYCKISGLGFVSKWHMLFCETTDIDTCPRAAALSGPRNASGRTALLWHHSHFCLFPLISCLLSFSWHFLS